MWRKGKAPAEDKDEKKKNDQADTSSMTIDDTTGTSGKEEQPGSSVTPNEEDVVYPHGLRLFLLMASVFISMFLVALDRLILSTAIPQITNDFGSVTDIGWYGAAYLLTNCSFQLLFGKVYTFWSVKLVLLLSILLFEVGSAVCGSAPNSIAFIMGRAIAGVGSAGIMAGVLVTIVYAVPLHKRPMFQGIFGAVFGVSSVVGPLIGGAFTDKVTWRWCFYINLPFGGVAGVFIFLLLDVQERASTKVGWKEKARQMDLPGTAVFLPGVVCLLLALQWGGSEYEWSNGRIIALLVLSGVLLIAFVFIQILRPDTATVPPRIVVYSRSIPAGIMATICVGASMMLLTYFLPVWFQAIKGVSALDSGIRLIPTVLPMVFATISSGILTSRIGYYTPFMILGSILMPVGAGMLNTLEVDSGRNKWIGYQVIYGLGTGFMMQGPNMAAQTVLPTHDVPIGVSLMLFCQLLGGSVFLAVGQNVLNNELLHRLRHVNGFDMTLLGSNGATTLVTQVPESMRATVLFAYNLSVRKVFLVMAIASALSFLGAIFMEWKSVRKHVQPKDSSGGGAAEQGIGKGTDGKELGDEVGKEMENVHESDDGKVAVEDKEKNGEAKI